MNENDIKATLIRTLQENDREVPAELSHDLNLFDNGVLDSITTMIFLENLNKDFNLALEGDVLFEDDFQSVAGITRILNR